MRTPEPVARYDEPFTYLAQYRHAVALGTGDPADLPGASGGSRTFVFSVGRCGSTLLTRVAEGAGLATLSEPDALVALAVDGCPPEGDRLYAPLLDANIGAGGLDPAARTLVKLRAQHSTPRHLARIGRAVPEADFVFVFREPRAWARSMVGHFGLTVERLETLYGSTVRACATALATDTETAILRYEDMADGPAATARALGLDSAAVSLPMESSQSGTRLAERPTLDADGARTVDAFMERWPAIAREHAFLQY